jgi:hypothetical protein
MLNFSRIVTIASGNADPGLAVAIGSTGCSTITDTRLSNYHLATV